MSSRRLFSPLLLLALFAGATAGDAVPNGPGGTAEARGAVAAFLRSLKLLAARSAEGPSSTLRDPANAEKLGKKRRLAEPTGPCRPAKTAVQKLEDECNARPRKFCVFFANITHPTKSKCTCEDNVPESALRVRPVGVQSLAASCETTKTISEAVLSAAGIVLGIFIAWATVNIGAPALAAQWALLGSVPDLISLPLFNLWTCEENKLVDVDFARLQAMFGEYYKQGSLQKATEFLEDATIQAKWWVNKTIPLYEQESILSSLKAAQIHALSAKVLGAETLAQIGVVMATQIANKARLVERQNCDQVVLEYEVRLQRTLNRIDDIREEFEGRFVDDVNCESHCGGGGCWCFFCGNERLTASCSSSAVNEPEYNFQLSGLKHGTYTCERCTQDAKNRMKFRATTRAQTAWTGKVGQWWDGVSDLYRHIQVLLDRKESVRNMCGQQCGPNVLVHGFREGQSCQCGPLPFCNLAEGRCSYEIPSGQTDRQYHCTEQFS